MIISKIHTTGSWASEIFRENISKNLGAMRQSGMINFFRSVLWDEGVLTQRDF